MKKALKWVGITAAVLLIVPLVVLLALGRRADAGKTHTTVDVAASRERVWTWLDDPAKLKQWVSWLVEARGPDPHAVGGKIAWVMKDENNGGEIMTMEGRLTEYDPPSRMTVAINSAQYGFDGTQSYRLTDLGNGQTRVETSGDYRYTMFLAKLMEPLITPSAAKKETGDLARLKTLVEAEAR